MSSVPVTAGNKGMRMRMSVNEERKRRKEVQYMFRSQFPICSSHKSGKGSSLPQVGEESSSFLFKVEVPKITVTNQLNADC